MMSEKISFMYKCKITMDKKYKRRKIDFQRGYVRYIKRILDILCVVLALIILAPLMTVIALIVKIRLGTPVIFKQKRIGKDNKEFLLLKFRSMTEEKDENGVYLPDEKRMTNLGKFIRMTSIDELPSLINILRGEMSVIGPRPLPVRYLPRYTKKQLRRHEIRPGLSNIATVNGRNRQSWEEQFESDVWYVDNISFMVDFKSVIETIKIVLTQKGATSGDGNCRNEFIGTADITNLTDNEKNYMKI